jgi:hypothetical protein
VSTPAPDPHRVRAASIDQLRRLDLPTPPPNFPLKWEMGDTVEMRPPSELEGRTAILNVVLARCFGMPGEAAMAWLLDAHLLDHLTKPEWSFVATGEGDHRSFTLQPGGHLRAGLDARPWWGTWIPRSRRPTIWSPSCRNLPSKETFMAWHGRTNPMPAPARSGDRARPSSTASTGALGGRTAADPPAGLIDSTRSRNGGGHWSGPSSVAARTRNPPRGWEEVDLSTGS